MMTRRRVLVLEDDDEIRSALAATLAHRGHDVVGAFDRCDSAVAAVVDARPDVAIVDLSLPGASGFEAIRGMLALVPELRIIVLTARNSVEDLLEALRAGATGYLVKGAKLMDIAGAVDAAANGLSPISPEAARHLVEQHVPRRQSVAKPVSLTARERQVLALLVEGHAYLSIASALGIGIGTVQNHVKSIYRKLEVSSKAEATAVAIRTGIVTRD